MHKLLIFLGVLILSSMSCMAATLPNEVVDYINNSVPGTDVRFDGVVILPDNTVYLPLFPSLFSDVKKLKVKESIPANMELKNKPDVIIFNNDFVMMKVISDNSGHRTVLHMTNPPLQVRTALLPQDMLVPSGLIIPENIKGIIGNLKIDTKNEDLIKLNIKESFEEFLSAKNDSGVQNLIPQLKNKTLFVTTNYSKNIQVVEPPKSSPSYSLAQKSIPIDVKSVSNGKFLLVTTYERPFLDVVSVADSRFIKQLSLGTFPEEIIVDNDNNKAYITAPKASTIFVLDLKTMSIVQKIRINGYCEKLILAGDKIFYVDKMKGDIWSIEIENDYTLRNLGKFPNVSSMVFAGNKLYLASRTKSRIAVLDYTSLSLSNEFTTVNKPIAMELYKNTLYILGAQNNIVQKIDINTGRAMGTIELGSDGFSSRLNRIQNTDLAVAVDVKTNKYSIVDLAVGTLLKTYKINVPLKDVVVADRVLLFE